MSSLFLPSIRLPNQAMVLEVALSKATTLRVVAYLVPASVDRTLRMPFSSLLWVGLGAGA